MLAGNRAWLDERGLAEPPRASPRAANGSKSALDADTVTGDAPDGECSVRCIRTMRPNHNAFKDLNALPRALNDFRVHAHGIAFGKLGQRILSFRSEECVDFRHCLCFLVPSSRYRMKSGASTSVIVPVT